MIQLNAIKKVYIIGIGGIGTSAFARLMLELGKNVAGSDVQSSEITTSLLEAGAKITIGKHQAKNVSEDVNLVIYTKAIKPSNPELVKAKKNKIQTLSYSAALGQLIHHYVPIVVSGTHGKSTVTSMLSKIFIDAGLDPTVVVGTKILELGTNARLGLSKYFLLEGDEYMESFLDYTPIGLIINNIEADHLDYYHSIENIFEAFKKLANKVPTHGIIVANRDNELVDKILLQLKSKVVSFGLKKGDFIATHIYRHGELTRFTVKGPENFDIAIRLPGIHNVYNALAAAVMAMSFGVPIRIIQHALLNYSGAWRRFEIKFHSATGITVIDDYAHHPTEIKATLKAASEYFSGRKIWCIFQPHSGPRTKNLFDDFTTAFQDCNSIVLTDIYYVTGRESSTKFDITKLFKAIKKENANKILIKDYKQVAKKIITLVNPGDVVITMGAGSITEVSKNLIKLLN